jgi:glucan phosphoethanolaminetransferase (alkaline phosphatase superfamily)
MTRSNSARARAFALGAIALLVALLLLPDLIWLAHAGGLFTWIQALVLPVSLLAALFALLGDVPWLACALLAPFALLAPMEAYYIALYHHPTSAEVIATVAATNPRETREYLGHMLVPLALALAAGLSAAVLAAWWSFRAGLRWRGRVRTLVLAVAVTAPLVCLAVTHAQASAHARSSAGLLANLADQIQPGYPFGVFQRIAEYRHEWHAMRANAASLAGFRFHAHRIGRSPRLRQVYVLAIGESSRRDHWQLFGYDRPTNPELSKLPDLVPIPHMLTSWPESIAAIPMIVTRRKPEMAWDAPWPEASILRAMQEAGYETYWISNQLAIGKFDSPVSMYAYEAEHVEWLNHASWTAPGSYDGDLIQPLQDALHDSNRDLFIVLHMMGSHLSYDYRYPPAFKRFRPTQSDAAGAGTTIERARNSYDNTILYTDHVLDRIIQVLRNSGAVTALWYESDHGETLPTRTCDKEGHGLGSKPEYRIPALVWYSGAYDKAFPGRVATLRANADRRTLSADTFESLIDMAGVAFPGHDESWSLFSPGWHYHERIVSQVWHVDFDDASFGKGCGIVLPPRRIAHRG